MKISAKEIINIARILKEVQKSGIVLRGVTETNVNQLKEQKGWFLAMLLGISEARLLGKFANWLKKQKQWSLFFPNFFFPFLYAHEIQHNQHMNTHTCFIQPTYIHTHIQRYHIHTNAYLYTSLCLSLYVCTYVCMYVCT